MNTASIVVLTLTVFGVSSASRIVPSYPVRLNHYGPSATPVTVCNSHLRTPAVERMPLRTAGCIPRPKTIGNTCTCIKTVVKPQVHNHIVSVPSIQRVIQTTARPVVEKIHYQATPIEPGLCSFPSALSLYSRCASPIGFPYGILPPRLPIPSCSCRNDVVLI